MTWIYALDIISVLVFAISGVLTAIDNKFDIVGAFIIGLVTALGGGSLRDIMIGKTPVGWMNDLNYLWTILLALFLAYLFRHKILKLRKSMFLFDTIGIGLATILGLEKTLSVGLTIPIALIMGVVSAVFGGVLRDILTNIVPLIFRKEIYASACFLGGLVYILLENISSLQTINMIVSISIVIVIRYFSIKNKWTLQLSPIHIKD
jgi:uncharacterized membrane protein YeiH